MEKDIDRINDRVNPDAEMFESVKASVIRDIREGDVEQRLKEAEQTKLSSNASIQDIITNSIEAYRNQEEPIEEEEGEDDEDSEEEEESSLSSVSSEEESLTQEMLSLSQGDIVQIATILTEGVEYRTNEGVKQLNGDKIRKLFVKELKKLLKGSEDFEDAFNAKLSESQKNQKLSRISTGKAPLMETATEVLDKYVDAKAETGLDKTIYLSKYVETEVGNDVFPALNFPEGTKRGFGVKNRQYKHNDDLEAQAQLNSMPRVAYQVKKKGRPSVKIGKGIDVAIPQDTRCCPLKWTFGFLHVPYQGKELRPVGSDFKVLRLKPFCALRP